MKKVLFLIVASCMVLVVPKVSFAEAYASIYAGGLIPHDSDIVINGGPSKGVNGEMTFKTGFTGGVKLGFWFGDQSSLGLQVDLNNQKSKVKTIVSATQLSDVTASADFYSATLNIMLRKPEGRIRPYIGAGAGWYIADLGIFHYRPAFHSLPGFAVEDGGFGWQVIAGVDSNISDHLSWFLEYKFNTAEFRFDMGNPIDMEYMASHFTVGLTTSF